MSPLESSSGQGSIMTKYPGRSQNFLLNRPGTRQFLILLSVALIDILFPPSLSRTIPINCLSLGSLTLEGNCCTCCGFLFSGSFPSSISSKSPNFDSVSVFSIFMGEKVCF